MSRGGARPGNCICRGGGYDFGGGTGTKEDPWLITSPKDLIDLASRLNSDITALTYHHFDSCYFKQTADIDLTDVKWEPIGYSGDTFFAGHYDGGGHIIANAKSSGRSDEHGYATAGIFGWVAFGSVQNLHVKFADFVATGKKNYSYVGGITGVCYSASIKNCSVTDSILESRRLPDNSNCAGSIVGYSFFGTFENCAAENNQVTSMAYGGGFVGELADKYASEANHSVFTNCYVADCAVKATTEDTQGVSLAGGFVGEISACTLYVNNCYVYRVALSTDGTATSTVSTGVLAGHLWNGSAGRAAISADKCFYGECGPTKNTEGALEQSAEEFENGTVAKQLGDAFAQARNYPKFKDSPADYSAVDAAIAKANALNKDDYNDFTAVEAAINAVVRGNPLSEQAKVDAMAQVIENAITALQYKDADYSAVDAAIAKASALNRDEYKDFSAVDAAVNAVVRGKTLREQNAVDAMAQFIEDAITKLQYKGADYRAVDAAIAKASALNRDEYKDFSAVEAAVYAVVRDKNITEQSEVDAMAQAIENAIAALQYKGADYSKVDAALAKANALNKDEYKDFFAVEAAVNAVVRGKLLTEQTAVDAMAKAIEDAIAALQYKGADYSAVDAAIAKADKLNRDEYKDFSAVEAAVRAVVRGKPLSEQDEVDAMAQAIETAIAALQYKGADYRAVDASIAKAKALNKNEYKDFSAVDAAVNAVVRGKPLSEQAEVDAMAKAIEDAITALEKKPVEMTVQLPQTGDDSNLALWTALLLVSGAAIGAMMAGKKKNYGK